MDEQIILSKRVKKVLGTKIINHIDQPPLIRRRPEILNFIRSYVDLLDHDSITISNARSFDFEYSSNDLFSQAILFSSINDIRDIDQFIENVNSSLIKEGLFIGCANSKTYRKEHILKRLPLPFNWIYYSLDFIYKRVFPKVWLISQICEIISKGKNKVLTKAEILGRLVRGGFDIINFKEFCGDECKYIRNNIAWE